MSHLEEQNNKGMTSVPTCSTGTNRATDPVAVHSLASQVGKRVVLQTVSGAKFHGIFKTFSPSLEITLECVHEINPDAPDNFENVTDTMVVNFQNIVYFQSEESDVDRSTLEFQTDLAISNPNFETPMKELVSWQPERKGRLEQLERAPGWSVHKMLHRNEQLFGVVSTYNPDLRGYTTPLPDSDTEEYKKAEAEALRIIQSATNAVNKTSDEEEETRTPQPQVAEEPSKELSGVTSRENKSSQAASAAIDHNYSTYNGEELAKIISQEFQKDPPENSTYQDSSAVKVSEGTYKNLKPGNKSKKLPKRSYKAVLCNEPTTTTEAHGRRLNTPCPIPVISARTVSDLKCLANPQTPKTNRVKEVSDKIKKPPKTRPNQTSKTADYEDDPEKLGSENESKLISEEGLETVLVDYPDKPEGKPDVAVELNGETTDCNENVSDGERPKNTPASEEFSQSERVEVINDDATSDCVKGEKPTECVPETPDNEICAIPDSNKEDQSISEGREQPVEPQDPVQNAAVEEIKAQSKTGLNPEAKPFSAEDQIKSEPKNQEIPVRSYLASSHLLLVDPLSGTSCEVPSQIFSEFFVPPFYQVMILPPQASQIQPMPAYTNPVTYLSGHPFPEIVQPAFPFPQHQSPLPVQPGFHPQNQQMMNHMMPPPLFHPIQPPIQQFPLAPGYPTPRFPPLMNHREFPNITRYNWPPPGQRNQ